MAALSGIDSVVGNQDLAFLVSQFLCPDRLPNLRVVSKTFDKAFSLVIAQNRWDVLTQHIQQGDDNDWIYHKLSYVAGSSADEQGRRIPREGVLRIFRSHFKTTCDGALRRYRADVQNDENSDGRLDSRADYFFVAHRETPECIEFVLPRPLAIDTVHIVNEIEYDDKPR